MEGEDINFSIKDLERRTYRYLQQIAKALYLPSNIKKVYLIELIHAKKYKTDAEVNDIIQKVKSERLQIAQKKKKNRKKYVQNREVSSTDKPYLSPPITSTPKRSVHPVIRYSPDKYSVSKCGTTHSYRPPSNMSLKSITSSDRVLRSFNLRTISKSYGPANLNNTVANCVRVQNQMTNTKEKFIKVISASGKLTKIKLKNSEGRYRPTIMSKNSGLTLRNYNSNQYIISHNPPQHSIALNQVQSVPESKRQRTLSGIYPLVSYKTPFQTRDHIKGLKVRKSDGRFCTINALVQKQSTNEYKVGPKQNNVNVQEIISSMDLNFNNTTNIQLQPHSNNYPVVDVNLNNVTGIQLQAHRNIHPVVDVNSNIATHMQLQPHSNVYPMVDVNLNNTASIQLQPHTNIYPTVDMNLNNSTHMQLQPHSNNYSVVDMNLNNASYTQLQPRLNNNPMVSNNNATVSEIREDETNIQSTYYHKKIRSEQMGFRRMSSRDRDDGLPKINEAFSRFNSVPNRSLMQPLYIQISDASDRVPNVYHTGCVSSTHMLESIYNFRASLLTNTPLLQMASTNNTKCVYSTPIIATAMAQQTVPLANSEPFTVPPYGADNPGRYSYDSHTYEQLRTFEQNGDFRCFQNGGDVSTETSPLSQATIPEMVEDALEIISQDGDYMERIGMDIRVQCVLCSWAGPKIILEYHIRKEHESQIHKRQESGEHIVIFTVGMLCERLVWVSAVLELGEALYVLSASYCDTNYVTATLCSLSSEVINKFGSITIYNKVTGEPYTWEGTIQPFPPNLPYENNLSGLTVDLSKLNLIPNSANLTLLNKVLVLKSHTKVVVGQPELNDIQIILSVRIS